jgi:hypothetical protein|nr:hypothetical protein [Neorhizobium tomejilense]
MFDFDKTNDFFGKYAKNVAGQAVVEGTTLIEAATQELAALGEFANALGKAKSPDDATNLAISYNTKLFQRFAVGVAKTIERGQVYSTLFQNEVSKAAKA